LNQFENLRAEVEFRSRKEMTPLFFSPAFRWQVPSMLVSSLQRGRIH
jgi:hypothetical protein